MEGLLQPAVVQELVKLYVCWSEGRSGYLVSFQSHSLLPQRKFRFIVAAKTQKVMLTSHEYIYIFASLSSGVNFNVVKWNLTQLTTRSAGVDQWSARWVKRGQPCLHHLHVLSITFPDGHSLRLAFGSFFYPHPTHWINQCDRCLSRSVGVGAHSWRARVYQPWGCNSV